MDARQPSRTGQALLTLACLYPASLATSAWLTPHLADWPRPLSTLLVCTILVATLTWILLPASHHALRTVRRLTRGAE
jgi:antibiotic biosynthesis monooxygenase (ABM) superfamily enzyme